MDESANAHLRIIDDYLAGRITVQDAAQKIMRLEAPLPNMDIPPRLRPLVAELHRLQTGTAPPAIPPYVPDPERHFGGGLRLVRNYAERTWPFFSAPQQAKKQLRLDCHVDAATGSAADRLASWFGAHNGFQVVVKSPAEAESDDWEVLVTTPAVHWTLHALREWESMLLKAPIGDDASYSGISVFEG
jgi:hypothetical protein